MTVTKTRELHTATPLWKSTPKIAVRSHKKPLHAVYDVVIIGAGISGALMAQALASATCKVLVIDRRLPVGGSSLASTAMIQHEIDVPLLRLGELLGADKANRAWKRSAAAVERLVKRAQALEIDCSMQRKKTLFLAGDEIGSRALAEEGALRRKIGLEAQFLTGKEIAEEFGMDRTGGIVSHCSASANPAQLTAGMLRAAVRQGAEIVSSLEVTDVATLDGRVVLSTPDGGVLSSGHAVFCTGYEFLQHLSSPQHTTASTWAIATPPMEKRPDWLDQFLVWEGSDPYLYFRSTADGRIVAGGEDEDDPQAHLDHKKLKAKSKTIVAKLSALLSMDVGEPEFAWSAPFGLTASGLPIIDEVPGLKNVFAVMGYGGNGITFSQIASELVAARIAGTKDADADLFCYLDHPPARLVA